jgi:hypothetical protein
MAGTVVGISFVFWAQFSISALSVATNQVFGNSLGDIGLSGGSPIGERQMILDMTLSYLVVGLVLHFVGTVIERRANWIELVPMAIWPLATFLALLPGQKEA